MAAVVSESRFSGVRALGPAVAFFLVTAVTGQPASMRVVCRGAAQSIYCPEGLSQVAGAFFKIY